jgi:hypothetical protein
MNLAVDALLTDATGDELRGLGTEVEDQDGLTIHGAAVYTHPRAVTSRPPRLSTAALGARPYQ